MSTEKNAERALLRQMDAAKALRESLASYEDADLLRDSIEGETDLHAMIGVVVDSMLDDSERIAGIDARIADIKERKERLEKAVERKRALIEQAMSIGELSTLAFPEATLSLGRRAPKLLVENEADIPATFWAAPPPKLDRSALTKALRDGATVPGASLDNGGVSLTVRRK